MRDRAWIYPAVFLTLSNAALALLLFPNPLALLQGLKIVPFWMLGTLAGFGVVVISKTLKMMRAGEERPLLKLREWADWQLVMTVMAAMTLACLNQTAFLWLKPTLNIYVPFTADPLLADIDRALFLNRDPWTLLTWLNNDWTGLIYHFIWYASITGSLMMLLSRPASARKAAMALTYFVCWSVIGPLIHCLLPAGGPIFYQRLGYGDRFAGIDGGIETERVADFLWHGFESGHFEVASGISAMPSLHVTLAVWTVLCVAQFKPRYALLVAFFAIYVFLLSISLGWHYAIDGIVGGTCAVFIYHILRTIFENRSPQSSTALIR